MKTDLLPNEEAAYSDVSSGQYERFRPLTPGLKVLDLGAHVGYFSERALKAGCIVAAFEPHPENFERLIERCSKYPGFKAVPAGAWEEDEETLLWSCPTNSGAHSYFRNGTHAEQPILTTRANIGRWCLDHFEPDFVKIDTEGSEVKIIRSILSAGFRPYFAFEAHSEALWDECRGIFVSYDYNAVPGECVVGINWGVPK
jgi:FkbM family methyltransferase